MIIQKSLNWIRMGIVFDEQVTPSKENWKVKKKIRKFDFKSLYIFSSR